MIDKKMKPVVQGGVDNYLGKQPQVQAPRKWQSSPDKPATELAYITEAEKDLILKANIHGGLERGPNMGPSGIMSLDSFGDAGGGGASGGDTDAGGGASDQGGGAGSGGFSGRSVAEINANDRDKSFNERVANERAALQIAERKQAQNLGYKERANIANRTYGPLQKYTGKSRFFGGANKYGYTDVRPDGSLKPGFGGRFFGGLLSLLTGIPFVGGAIGNMYDKGKGIFAPKKRDMSKFNKLGLGGVKPGTYDFNPDAKINQTIDPATLQGLNRFGDIGQPNINNLESLVNSYTTGSIPFNPGMTVGYGTGIERIDPSVTESYNSASDLPAEFQDMAIQAGNYAQNEVGNQLYGKEYDVLNPFEQEQINKAIETYGTKSTGQLASGTSSDI